MATPAAGPMQSIYPHVRIALYARVSTTDQDPDLQLVEFRRYAGARGWVMLSLVIM